MSNVYTTAQVAELMGVSADTVRTWKKRNPDKLTEGSHWIKDVENNILLWTTQGVELLKRLGKFDEPSCPVSSSSVFYVVQLVPELSPLRVKLGYSISMSDRLATFKTICPTAKCVQTWYCLPEWEQVAIVSATRTGCKKLSREVFDCNDLHSLIERCDQFFSLMPGKPNGSL